MNADRGGWEAEAKRRSARRSLEPKSSRAVQLIQLVVLLLVLAAPWPFGGVNLTHYIWPFATAALVVWATLLGRRPAPKAVLPWAALPLALALAAGALQLVHWPSTLLEAIDPVGLRLWKDAEAIGRPTSAALNAAIAFPITLNPTGTRIQLSWLVLALAFFLLGAHFFRTRAALLVLFGALAAEGAALALFSIVQRLQWNGKLYWFVELTQGGEPFGPFINRNHCGACLNLCLAGAIGLMLWTLARSDAAANDDESLPDWLAATPLPSKWNLSALRRLDPLHWLAGTAVAVLIAGVVASLSRGATASAAVGLGAILLASMVPRRNGRDLRASAAVLLAAGVLTAAGVGLVFWVGLEDKAVSRFSHILDDPDDSQTSRIRHWREMTDATEDYRWTGAGLGAYGHLNQLYTQDNHRKTFEHAENSYLEAAVELGAAGVVAVCAFLLLAYRTVYVLLRHDRDRIGPAFALAGLFALTTQAVHAVVDFALYMPANFMLFSLWMGAASGRAARVAAQAVEEGSRARWVALPFGGWTATTAAMLAALIPLALWSWREAYMQEEVAWTLRDAKRLQVGPATGLAAVNESIQRLESLAADDPTDPLLAERLAERWIDRYRLQAFAVLQAQKPAATLDDLWNRTDVGDLYGLARFFRSRGAAALESLRQESAVAKNLPRAREHLQDACRLGPLPPWPRLRLAQLDFLVDAPSLQTALLEQVRRLAPGDAELLYRVGLQDYYSGRREDAKNAWGRSLRISERWFGPIFNLSLRTWGAAETIATVIPRDARLYLLAAGMLQAAPVDRALAVEKAVDSLPESNLPPRRKFELAGRVYTAAGKLDSAAANWRSAIELKPTDPQAHRELAQILAAKGNRAEAAREALIAAGLNPRDLEFRRYADSLQRAVE